MSDFYDDAPAATEPDPRAKLGPIFTATYESDCAACSDLIVPGEDIRADGQGGWIHADDDCEAITLARTDRNAKMCPRCWLTHAPGQTECQ